MATVGVSSSVARPAIFGDVCIPFSRTSAGPSVQWSSDGQACLITKTAIHMLMPNIGLNCHHDSFTQVMKHADSHGRNRWFNTTIEWDDRDTCDNTCQGSSSLPLDLSHLDWSALALGVLDPGFRAVVFSPSNVTKQAGCMLAVLNSNMHLTLWIPPKNALKDSWTNVYDVTAFLVNFFGGESLRLSALARILQVQVTSMAWATNADFGLQPAPKLDTSLLVVGNRAGCLLFLRLHKEARLLRIVHRIQVSQTWITLLEFSPWFLTASETCESQLAYATSDGSIGLLRITQVLNAIECGTLSVEFAVRTSFGVAAQEIFAPNGRNVLSLNWFLSGHKLLLVHVQPGCVYVHNQDSTAPHELTLHHSCLSIGASAFHPISGMQYLRPKDALLISLNDGSIHILHGLFSANPTFSPSKFEQCTSDNVSEAARTVFKNSAQTANHGRPIRYTDVDETSGFVLYDGVSIALYMHSIARPSDFSFKIDGEHSSNITAAQLWDDENPDLVLQNILHTLTEATSASGTAPISFLRSALLTIEQIPELHPRLLDALKPPNALYMRYPDLEQWKHPYCPALRRKFGRSMAMFLFGWDDLLALRLRLGLTDHCWSASRTDVARKEYGLVTQALVNAISQSILGTIIAHLSAVATVLRPNDMFFALRMISQATLAGSPSFLSERAIQLSEILHGSPLCNVADHRTVSLSEALNEPCPACNEMIPMDWYNGIAVATCRNGHSFPRCSMTTFILATSMVRTCIGCNRKAFLPLSTPLSEPTSNWLPVPARSWVVASLLEAANRCLFCGNTFLSIL